MTCPEFALSRRNFIAATAALGVTGLSPLPATAWSADSEADINIVGPKPGYSPQIGTLVSMLTWMRTTVLRSVKGMSQKDLDYLFDPNANTIGAMLQHLAATETYYQMNTLDGKAWDSWSDEVKKKWDIPMELGEPARKAIKGNNLDYYVNILGETREHSLAEFRKRDDAWLMGVDQNGRGVRRTITASGSTCVSTSRITTARSSSLRSGCRGRSRAANSRRIRSLNVSENQFRTRHRNPGDSLQQRSGAMFRQA